jgi:hypothetical protein
MCSSCKTTVLPLYTRILPDRRSVVMCRACLSRMAAYLEPQLQQTSDAARHYCRVGLQYQSLRPRLLRAE